MLKFNKITMAIFCFFLMFLIITFDQFSKSIIQSNFAEKSQFNYSYNDEKQYEIFSFLNLVKVKNYGISFGIFNKASQNQYLMSGLSLLALCFFVLSLLPKYSISLAVISSGAIGNIIDRFRYGYVVDFIDFHFENYHFPSFNIADAAIFMGISSVILQELMKKK